MDIFCVELNHFAKGLIGRTERERGAQKFFALDIVRLESPFAEWGHGEEQFREED